MFKLVPLKGSRRVQREGSGTEGPMSALGQKQTSDRRLLMSAIPPKADIDGCSPNVRFVPKADSCAAAKTALFDYLVGAVEPRSQAELVDLIQIKYCLGLD